MNEVFQGGGISRGQWPGSGGGSPGPTEISRFFNAMDLVGQTGAPFTPQPGPKSWGWNSLSASAYWPDYYYQPIETFPVDGGPEGRGSLLYFLDTPPKEFSGAAFNFRIYFVQKAIDTNATLGDIGGKISAAYFNSGDPWNDPPFGSPGRSFVVSTGFDRLFIGSTATTIISGTRAIDSIIRFRVQTDSGLPGHILNAFRILGIEIIYPL